MASFYIGSDRLFHQNGRGSFLCYYHQIYHMQICETGHYCRYGLPEQIIMDNTCNLINKVMKAAYLQFKIQHRNSIPYYPKVNEAVRAANKNIKKIVEKLIEAYKD